MTDLPGEIQRLAAQEPYVRSLARTLMKDDVDEIVQQTYIQALAKDPGTIRRPRQWLARIARNVASNLRRGRSRRAARERESFERAADRGPGQASAPHVPSSVELMEREERRHALITAVDRLPAPLRAVIWLRFFEDLPPREVARELDIPATIVWERQRRGLELLRRKLDAAHEDRRAWLLPLLPHAPFVPGLPVAAPATPLTSTLLPALVPSLVAMTAKAKIAIVATVCGLAALAYWALPPSHASSDPVTPTAGAPEDQNAAGLTADNVAKPGAGGDETPLTRTVAEPGSQSWTIRGVVHTDESEPVSGARITAEVHAGYTTESDPESTSEFVSDKDGKFHWPISQPNHTVTLRFRSNDPKLLTIGNVTHLVLKDEEAPQDVVVKVYRLECRLSGTVVDGKDRPIEGANVISSGRSIPTDAAGAFDVWIPAWSFHQFLVVAGGYGIQYTSVQLDGPGSHAKTTVKLKIAQRVKGRVLDEDGAPVPGAEVSSMLSDSHHRVTTDSEGRYEVDWLRAGTLRHSLYARKKGYAPVRHNLDFNNAKDSYDITLTRGIRIEGRVLDPSRQPVAGAKLALGEHSPHKWQTIADDEGRFVFEDINAHRHQFSATAPADRGLAIDARTLDVPKDPATMILDVFLQASRSIAGTVVDTEGEPIAGARLGVYLSPFKMGPMQESDARGKFRIEGLTDGEHRLTCFKVGFLRREMTEQAGEENLRIELDVAGFTAGRVIDGNTGLPIQRYRIYQTPATIREGENAGISLGFGDAGKDVKKKDGVWESKYPSPPGSVLGILVRAEGYATGVNRRVISQAKPDPEQNVMKLYPGSEIRGKVLDPRGVAVAGATIFVVTKDQPLDPGPFARRSTKGTVQTDENGEFTLPDAPIGEMRLLVTHAKWPVFQDGPFTTTAETPTDREIRLPESATVVGTLYGLDGKPAPGVKVRLGAKNVPGTEGIALWTKTTDATGEFRFDTRIGAGSYVLEIPSFDESQLGNAYIFASVEVERSGTHRVDLGPVGKCELLVTLPGLVASRPVYVHLSRLLPNGERDDSVPTRWMQLPSTGREVLRGLPPGRYRVAANMEQGKGQVFVDVSESKRASVELVLKKAK